MDWMVTGESLTSCARPRKTFIVASVAMNGGMRNRAIIKPLARPMRQPSARMMTQLAMMPQPGQPGMIFPTIFVKTTDDSAIWEAMDRSMPPEMMANVMPMPQTANMAPSFRMSE